MSSIDDRIVKMQFDNKQFESGVKESMNTLDKLKTGLNFRDSSKGLSELSDAANKFSLSKLGDGVSTVAGKFTAFGTMAIGALMSIGAKAATIGTDLVKSLTLDPIMDGFREYETNMTSIQTILANTQAAGTNLEDVNNALNELNHYADQTIYNFSEMARNIGTFTAAGVDLETSTAAIKGISNLAALSGSNSQQASTAMYQLSQALSSGRVSLQDWNSVVNAGMGGTVFQRALAQTAERMGTLSEGMVKLDGDMKNVTINGQSFRESITAKPGEESWLTSEVLLETLKQFTGDLTDAELAAQGFTEEQIKAIQAQAATAKNAATEVKTFTGLMDTLKEGVGSGWAQTFTTIIGDFEESKALFTAISNTVGGIIGKSSDARNQMLKDWKELGGRTSLLNGLSKIWEALVAVVTPIREAFQEFFPATTGADLVRFTRMFENFANTLKPSEKTIENIKRAARGLFAVLKLGSTVILEVVKFIGKLFGLVWSGSGSFLDVAADIGDFLVRLTEIINQGQFVQKFFEGMNKGVETAGAALKDFKKSFGGIFGGVDTGGIKNFQMLTDVFERLRESFKGLTPSFNSGQDAFGNFFAYFEDIGKKFSPIIDAISNFSKDFFGKLREGFSTGNFDAVRSLLNTGLLGGVILFLKKLLDNGIDINFEAGGGLIEGIKDSIEGLTGTLTAMQNQIQAKTLLLIAAAVGLLTLSIIALSGIDSASLAKSLLAITVGFTQLFAGLSLLTKMTGTTKGAFNLNILAGGLIIMAGAILVLSLAVRSFATLSMGDLAKGLIGVGVSLAFLVAAANKISQSGGKMMAAGLAMIPMAIGLNILAGAVKTFGEMSLATLAKGLGSIAGALVAIGLGMKLMPKGMVAQGLGLILIAASLNLIAGALSSFAEMTWGDITKGLVTLAGALVAIGLAMKLMPLSLPITAFGLVLVGAALILIANALSSFAEMSWSEIARGMTTLAGSLIIIALAMNFMPKHLPFIADGLIMVGIALNSFAQALGTMGSMSWDEIARGLTALGGSMLILAGGLNLMNGTLSGSAALMVATLALAMLTPVLITLGALPWEMIATGLIAIAGVFAVIGVAGLLLTPVIPQILALGAAMLMIGAAAGLAGAGLFLIASAFSIFVATLTATVGVIGTIIAGIPKVVEAIILAIVEFVTQLAASAGLIVAALVHLGAELLKGFMMLVPLIGKAITVLIETILNIIIDLAPKLGEAAVVIITTFLDTLRASIVKIIEVAVEIVQAFLGGIAANQGSLLESAVNLILSFIQGITSQVGRLVAAGVTMIVDFVTGILNTVGANSQRVVDSVVDLVTDLIVAIINTAKNSVTKVIQAATDLMVAILTGIGNSAQRVIDTGIEVVTDLVVGVLNGLNNSINRIINAAVDLALGIMTGINNASDRVLNAAAQLVIDLINKLANTIRNKSPEIREAGRNLGSAIIDGMTGGLSGGSSKIVEHAKSVARNALNAAKNILGIASPSKEFYKLGVYSTEGMANGLSATSNIVESASESVAKSMLDTMRDALTGLNTLIDSDISVNPVITPVLDLTDFSKGTAWMSKEISTINGSAGSGYRSALDISSREDALSRMVAQGSSGVSVNLTQNNNSPKSLTVEEVYTQTKNLMSLTKEALNRS